MAQAPIGTGVLSDWLPVPFASMIWETADQAVGLVNDITTLAPDQLEQFASADVTGGAIPKPTLFPVEIGDILYANHWSIPIPDFVINKQPERLLDWSGLLGDDMGISGDDIAGRRVALQIEYVLSSRDLLNGIDTIGPALLILFVAKYRGFGAIEVNPAPGTNGDTEDTPIASDILFAGAVFDDMSFPSGGGATLNNAGLGFEPDGIARFQWLIEVPSTVAVGDQVEITMGIDLNANRTPAVNIQFQHCIYRWIRDPFPFETNRGAQLFGQDAGDLAQGGDPDRALLEPQSRQDGDTDADPYAP